MPDCDAVFNEAVAAGSTIESAVSNQFWGDRSGCILDPFGLNWMILTHGEDLSPEEIARRGAECMSEQK